MTCCQRQKRKLVNEELLLFQLKPCVVYNSFPTEYFYKTITTKKFKLVQKGAYLLIHLAFRVFS